jgi:hypothetical protein
MLGSAIVYLGLIVAVAGVVRVVAPNWFRIPTRRRAFGVVGVGVLITGLGLGLPASESRVTRPDTRLDEFAPAWQFREFHALAATNAKGQSAFAMVGASGGRTSSSPAHYGHGSWTPVQYRYAVREVRE